MFLTRDEYEEIVGKTLAGISVGKSPGSFERVEETAGELVTGATGVAAPDDAGDAAPWAKDAVAFIILYMRLGMSGAIDRETRLWVSEQYRRVVDGLPTRRTNYASKSSTSKLGTIEGLIEW